jgi:DNA polymerase III delta prime subunit
METPSNAHEQEIAVLRDRIKQRREAVASMPESRFSKESITSEILALYARGEEEEGPLFPQMKLSEEKGLLARLSPKTTDDKVKLLAQTAIEKGIKQAFLLAEKDKDEELADDFHRYLVQYLLIDEKLFLNLDEKVFKALHMKLYEVIVPDVQGHDEGAGKVKEVMTLMQQWLTQMQSIGFVKGGEEAYFTFELALSEGSNDISFYVAVPREFTDHFEKSLVGTFPELRVEECPNDFNIFTAHGVTSASYAKPSVSAALPLKIFKDLEGDALSGLLSAFTKIKKDSEGASVQVAILPHDETSQKKFTRTLDEMKKGMTWKRALIQEDAVKDTFHIAKELLFGDGKKEDDKKITKFEDEEVMKEIQKKLGSAMVRVSLSIVVSAESKERADAILRELELSYSVYATQVGGGLSFAPLDGADLHDFVHDFEYRIFKDNRSFVLSLEEVATIAHFPLYSKEPGQLRSTRAKIAQAPMDLPKEGVLLGYNKYRHLTTQIFMGREDRMRHLYVIGQTGTGKTTILKNLIIQDIKNGDGCCFIDPHGSDIEDILANVPKERLDDVVYFDPSYTARPVGLNMLEYDRNRPEQKIFVINELLSIFKKLFAASSPESMGPAFEQYFRNTAMLVMEHPESGMTLLDLSRVLSDKDYRDYKLSKCKNPLVAQFWKNAEATTGDQGLQNYVPYISNKFDVFLSNDIMRPIIAQEKSTFDIREMMDKKKIFLVNLSKGRLGDINAQLIGLILVGKFLQAALSRVDSEVRPDFYLYIDEFQNVTTPSISAILSEARKYRLSLNVAHQYIAQLPDDIKSAVFGNVGSKAIYRVGPDDSEYLQSQVAPVFDASDILKIDNYNCYLSLLSKGSPVKPFNMTAYPAPKGNPAIIEKLKELSFYKYGRPREEVESEIMRKYS